MEICDVIVVVVRFSDQSKHVHCALILVSNKNIFINSIPC